MARFGWYIALLASLSLLGLLASFWMALLFGIVIASITMVLKGTRGEKFGGRFVTLMVVVILIGPATSFIGLFFPRLADNFRGAHVVLDFFLSRITHSSTNSRVEDAKRKWIDGQRNTILYAVEAAYKAGDPTLAEAWQDSLDAFGRRYFKGLGDSIEESIGSIASSGQWYVLLSNWERVNSKITPDPSGALTRYKVDEFKVVSSKSIRFSYTAWNKENREYVLVEGNLSWDPTTRTYTGFVGHKTATDNVYLTQNPDGSYEGVADHGIKIKFVRI
jgi:hypothetical protein